MATLSGEPSGNCGMAIITGITAGGPKKILLDVCKRIVTVKDPYNPQIVPGQMKPHGLYMFSGSIGTKARPITYGTNLAAYIREHKLGSVVGSVSRRNPVYQDGHHVRAWIWAANKDNLEKWYMENKEG